MPKFQEMKCRINVHVCGAEQCQPGVPDASAVSWTGAWTIICVLMLVAMREHKDGYVD